MAIASNYHTNLGCLVKDSNIFMVNIQFTLNVYLSFLLLLFYSINEINNL
jgi:hypothetical protein